jgi:hypothetical protein
MQTRYEYLVFEKAAQQPPKTSVWDCKNIRSGTVLGIVKWYGPWRRYCYFPEVQAVYSAGCLDDISRFIRQLGAKEHKTLDGQDLD